MMKRHLIAMIWIGVLLGLSLSARGSDPSDWEIDSERAIAMTALNSRLTRAYEEENVPLLREMLASDHVHNNVFGSALSKEVFLGDIESGVLVFESYKTPEIRWQFRDDLAVATGIIEAQAIRDGKAVPAKRFLFTRIFVRREGEWKVLLFHNTMARKPPEPPQ